MTTRLNATEVATHLSDLTGDVWTVKEMFPYGAVSRSAQRRVSVNLVRESDDLQISWGIISNDEPTKFWPNWDFDLLRYTEDRPSIGVKVSRGSKVIAREIANRLLPKSEELHPLIVERVTGRQSHAQATASTKVRMAKFADFYNDGNVGRVHMGGVWGDAQISGESVNLDLHGLPVELAEQVLTLIQSNQEK